MKYTKNILGTMLLTAVVTASCVDDKPLAFEVEKPASIAGMEYLNDYDVLKNYVSSSANPDFKLGIALAASDYIAGGQVTQLANSNFVEMTAGNAMKYASCVNDAGEMNFDAVENFVTAAKAGGLTIYGHTLAWHSQQNNKYLNSLIKDKEVEIDPDAANHFIKYICGGAGAEIWDKQATYILPNALEQGVEYTFKVDIKASETFEGLEFWPIWEASPNKNEWGGSNDVQYLGAKGAIGTDWATYEWKFTSNFPLDKLQIVFGKFGGTVCFDNLVLVKDGTEDNLITNGDFSEESTEGWGNNWNGPSFEIGMEGAGPAIYYVDQVNNGKMEIGQPMDNFIVRESGKADVPGVILEGQGPDGINCISITSISGAVNTHDTQFFIVTDKVWEAGEQYRISFWYKATAEAPCETQCHVTPGAYIHWAMLPQNPNFTTEWQHYEATGIIPAGVAEMGMRTIAFNLNADKENGHTYYFADIHWETVEKGNTIPLTPQEKKEVLTAAMNNWIEGMMKATDGYVTTWDVVNEAISGGGDDGEGFYTLQSASNVSADDAKNNFYWQDYLGNEDYVRIAVAAARKYYAENGGTAPLKLFINDYNLESDWDDNKKVKSLVHWIKKWEADNVTKIDGIGTQMHVSCYANEATQKSKEEHVVKMFEILAESGKLVKISELDMGYVDENENSVKTENMTEAQHKAMAEYYKFIVKKYFEIIPADQQYGITQWCITDAPSDSGWRGGEPVGLWDSNYSRKHTYAGFADGLAGK